jgi:hypothetical protein
MNDRDYLRSLGFTVGERGRFSKEMLTALAARSEQERDDLIADAYDHLNLPAPREPVREAQELYGFTKGGSRLAFITCSSCGEHMIWCECEKIVAPDNVMVLHGAAKELAVIHPRMLQLIATN